MLQGGATRSIEEVARVLEARATPHATVVQHRATVVQHLGRVGGRGRVGTLSDVERLHNRCAHAEALREQGIALRLWGLTLARMGRHADVVLPFCKADDMMRIVEDKVERRRVLVDWQAFVERHPEVRPRPDVLAVLRGSTWLTRGNQDLDSRLALMLTSGLVEKSGSTVSQ